MLDTAICYQVSAVSGTSASRLTNVSLDRPTAWPKNSGGQDSVNLRAAVLLFKTKVKLEFYFPT
jgi:hypothetical protein